MSSSALNSLNDNHNLVIKLSRLKSELQMDWYKDQQFPVTFDQIEIDKEEEDDFCVKRLVNELRQFVNDNRTQRECQSNPLPQLEPKRSPKKLKMISSSSSNTSPSIKTSSTLTPTNLMILFKSQQWDDQVIRLIFKPSETFVKGICGIFSNPVLSLKGKIEMGTTQYFNHINKSFDLKHILEDYSRNRDYFHTLDDSIKVEKYEDIKFSIDLAISLKWSIDLTTPIKLQLQNLSPKVSPEQFLDEKTKDFSFVAGNGSKVKCHLEVLQTGASPALAALVSSNNLMRETETFQVEMFDLSEEALSSFLRYLYGLPLPLSNLSSDLAFQLFHMGHKYALPHLEESMGLLFLCKSWEWFTPDVVLELYYLSRNLELFPKLKSWSLRIMTRMSSTDLRLSERFQELMPEEREDLLWKLFDLMECSQPK